MKAVSLIIASLPNYNPGMVAVNRAAIDALTRPDIELSVYEAVSRIQVHEYARSGELLGQMNRVLDADKIVLWGDWLHMQHYIDDLSRASEHSAGIPGPVARQELVRHLFLVGLPTGRMSDVALVGTTFALDPPLARLENGFGENVERLYGQAGLALMRDTFSSGLVEAWRKQNDRCSGLDAALLYRPREFSDVQGDSKSTQFGYFLGRGTSRQMALAGQLITNFGRTLDLTAAWIPWFAKSFRVRLGKSGRFQTSLLSSSPLASKAAYKWKSLCHLDQDSLDTLINQIRTYEYVITDTYHLAVIAWSQAVPCILFGNASTLNRSYVNSGSQDFGLDKRLALYLSLDALPFFVPYEDLE